MSGTFFRPACCRIVSVSTRPCRTLARALLPPQVGPPPAIVQLGQPPFPAFARAWASGLGGCACFGHRCPYFEFVSPRTVCAGQTVDSSQHLSPFEVYVCADLFETSFRGTSHWRTMFGAPPQLSLFGCHRSTHAPVSRLSPRLWHAWPWSLVKATGVCVCVCASDHRSRAMSARGAHRLRFQALFR